MTTALIKKEAPSRVLTGDIIARGLGRQEIKLQRFLSREQTIREIAGKTLELGKNPAISLVLAFTLVESLQKVHIMPELAGSVVEGALITDALLGSLGGDLLGAIAKLFVK